VSRPHRPARLAIAPVVIAAAVLALAGCDGGAIGADTPVSNGQSFVGSSYQTTVFTIGQRPEAPAVSGPTVTGGHVSLASFRGDVIVVNFWGSWCAPCRDEAPALGTLARNLYSRGVRFVGIDIRDEPDAAIAFMQDFRIGYPSISDPDDEIALAFRTTDPPAAIPSTIVIDRTGHIAARIIGAVNYRGLLRLLTTVAAEHA
jgi:peroxiredoxin